MPKDNSQETAQHSLQLYKAWQASQATDGQPIERGILELPDSGWGLIPWKEGQAHPF